MKRLILFLIRRRLYLKKFEVFRFANQKSTHDYYFFGNYRLWKYDYSLDRIIDAHVSLNWILDDKCEIVNVINLPLDHFAKEGADQCRK